jgi:hypothetical protein
MLQRQCACGTHAGGGRCDRCRKADAAAGSTGAGVNHKPAVAAGSETNAGMNLTGVPAHSKGSDSGIVMALDKVYQDSGADSGPGAGQGSLASRPDAGTHEKPHSLPGTSGLKCKVDGFGMSFKPWNVSWPGHIFGGTTVRLPVKFRLDLSDGCAKEDCVIGQDRKGQVERAGHVDDDFPDFSADSGFGFRYWWDGKDWNTAGGSWDWFGKEGADFKDEPGFNDVDRDNYPLYWGGHGHKDHFEFKTYVADKATDKRIRELRWGLLIDYSAPKTGKRFFYR